MADAALMKGKKTPISAFGRKKRAERESRSGSVMSTKGVRTHLIPHFVYSKVVSLHVSRGREMYHRII